jgi:hypothetical protein
MVYFSIRVALLKPTRERLAFDVTLSDEDEANARAVDSVEGRAIWRLTQHLVATGREVDLDAQEPIFEILDTLTSGG